jgi:hypothetical protein
MKKYIAVLVACLGLTALGLQTAQAAPETTASHQSVQQVQTAQATYAPWHIYNGHKWTIYEAPQVPSLCILDGVGAPTVYPIGTAAQAWNNASAGVAITVSNRCDGWGPGTRATVDTYSALDSSCVRVIGAYWTTNPIGSTDGFRTWTNTPVSEVQVNSNYNCNSTGQRRAHWVSVAIGMILGLRHQGSTETSFASRVMCDCSQDTVAYPSASTDGDAVTRLYRGDWVGPCYPSNSSPDGCGSGTTYHNQSI